uniref:Uncharacterized protein n=1 Tax=Stegastes partitus TaxID=144197 RepID=A0A3B5AXR0_9TELE
MTEKLHNNVQIMIIHHPNSCSRRFTRRLRVATMDSVKRGSLSACWARARPQIPQFPPRLAPVSS